MNRTTYMYRRVLMSQVFCAPPAKDLERLAGQIALAQGPEQAQGFLIMLGMQIVNWQRGLAAVCQGKGDALALLVNLTKIKPGAQAWQASTIDLAGRALAPRTPVCWACAADLDAPDLAPSTYPPASHVRVCGLCGHWDPELARRRGTCLVCGAGLGSSAPTIRVSHVQSGCCSEECASRVDEPLYAEALARVWVSERDPTTCLNALEAWEDGRCTACGGPILADDAVGWQMRRCRLCPRTPSDALVARGRELCAQHFAPAPLAQALDKQDWDGWIGGLTLSAWTAPTEFRWQAWQEVATTWWPWIEVPSILDPKTMGFSGSIPPSLVGLG